ncbi:MAG: hypothetical protein U0361_20490 [Nitrospiraceae bacterium]
MSRSWRLSDGSCATSTRARSSRRPAFVVADLSVVWVLAKNIPEDILSSGRMPRNRPAGRHPRPVPTQAGEVSTRSKITYVGDVLDVATRDDLRLELPNPDKKLEEQKMFDDPRLVRSGTQCRHGAGTGRAAGSGATLSSSSARPNVFEARRPPPGRRTAAM